MKWILFSIMALFIATGCQNFRYHDPAKPHRGKTRFYNNYNNDPPASFWKWQWERLTKTKIPEAEYRPEVLRTDVKFLQENTSKDTLTWVGHATALVQIAGLNILLDPVFSERASPFSFVGPKRLVPLPFELTELPEIDVVLISHSHYDHLDLPTLKRLASRPGNKTLFLVPLGIAEILQKEKITAVKEFDWWESLQSEKVHFTFVPAQHWSARGLFDRNQTLWGGWFFSSAHKKVLFAGDTGYSKDYQDIRARMGAPDVALIPIGAYEPRWFMRNQHVNPDESVQMHHDLQSKFSIGVHWGTFRLTDETMVSPPEDLKLALTKNPPVDGSVFRVLKHGEMILF